MTQITNHTSQSTAFVVEKFPIHWNKYGQLRYWVEYIPKKKQDRLFIQLRDGSKWGPVKTKETNDIILLELDDDKSSDQCGLVFPVLWDANNKTAAEIIDFAQYYQFNNVQKGKLVAALSEIGCLTEPLWLNGDVTDIAPPAVIDKEHNKHEKLRCKLWKWLCRVQIGGVPGCETPMEFRTRTLAHIEPVRNERGEEFYQFILAQNMITINKVEEIYDHMFDEHYFAEKFGDEWMSNYRRAIKEMV